MSHASLVRLLNLTDLQCTHTTAACGASHSCCHISFINPKCLLFAGTGVFSIVNLIFITQSLSTLDSTFTSAAKLMGPEFTGATSRQSYQQDFFFGKAEPEQSFFSVTAQAPCLLYHSSPFAAGLVEDGCPKPPNKASRR